MLLHPNIYAFATHSYSMRYKTISIPSSKYEKIEQFSLPQTLLIPVCDRTKKRPDRNSRLDQVGNVI